MSLLTLLFLHLLTFFTPEDMFIDFKERGREWEGRENERKRHRCEKHQSVASRMCPDRGSNPQPRYML